MKAQIRPNRLDISDRFPLASFTIHTDGQPRVAEIVLATDPELFTKQDGRSRTNFFSSREQGVLSLPRAEAVYTLPPDILARFIDADKLWFGMATAPANNGDRDWAVDVLPTGSSPYISLSGLTDSSLRRVRMFPRRTAQSGFGDGADIRLIWAGDAAQPGMAETGQQAPRTANGTAPGAGGTGTGSNATQGQPTPPAGNADVPYDDGFGPLPAAEPDQPADQPADQTAADQTAAGQGLAGDSNGTETDTLDDQGIDGPVIDGPVIDTRPPAEPAALSVRPRALTAAEYSGVTRILPSPAYSSGRSGQAIDRIVIHITDAPQSRWLGSWFTREEANSSSHYMVDQNGAILQFVREQDTAWHAGNRTGNRRSIGIEHVAVKRGGATYGSTTYPHTPPSAEEYRASAALVAHLCNKYSLTPNRTTIVGHNEIHTATTHSSCPTGAWDWDAYMPLVSAAFAAFGSAGGVGGVAPAQALGVTQISSAALEAANYSVSSQRRSVSAPETRALTTGERIALDVALLAVGGLGLLAARHVANQRGLSLAVGVAVGAGAEFGASVGAGIIFAPGDEIGVYGLGELDIGEIFSASATVQVTIMSGGIAAFHGISKIAAVSGGEGVVGGITAIFDTANNLTGVTFEAGFGMGSPVSVYVGVQASAATAVAHGMMAGTVEVLDLDNAALAAERQPIQPPQVEPFSVEQNAEVQTMLAANPPLAAYIQRARQNAGTKGISIGIGPQPKAGEAGSGAASGLIFAPQDGTGRYGSAPIDAAMIAGMGSSFQLTVLRGGTDGFKQIANAGRLTGPDVPGGAIVIFDSAGKFLGASLTVSADVSLGPVEIYETVQRLVGTQVGLAQAFASQSDAVSAGLGAGNEQVEIKYRMFIPSPIIAGLPIIGDFGGDGRNFSYSSGTSRGEMTALVEVTPGGGIASVRTTRRHWEPSTAYNRDDTVAVAGKPSWWKDKKNASVHPTTSSGLTVSDSNMRIYRGAPGTFRSVYAVTSNSSPVTMMASGNNALVPGSPNIDADVTVYFRRNSSGGVEVKAYGSHDGFPAHEIYVNGQRIHDYDPVAHGNSPVALLPPSDRDVDTSWRAVARRTSSGQSLPADALGVGPNPTINWDEVQLEPQPTNQSCWATAGAMLYGWMNKQSINPQTIANFAGKTVDDYLQSNRFQQFADDVGFDYDGGQSYTPEGFFGRLEQVGPLLVLKNNPPILHCVIVTGMYRAGNQWMVRITDPWDRAVGSPGAPGQYAASHQTGSRYIMKYEDFVAEYEDAAGVSDLQVLHGGGHHGHVPNRGPTKPAGYAQSADETEWAKSETAEAPLNGAAAPTLNGEPVSDHPFGPQVTVTRQQLDKGQRHYDLAQLRGFVQPQTGTMAASDAMRAEPVLLEDWPYMDGPGGRTQAGIAIDWAYKDGAVGQIGITPLDGQSPDGWDVAVKADLAMGTPVPGKAQVKVRITTTFTKPGEPEQIAVSEVTLDGDGRSNVQHAVGETGATNGAAVTGRAPEQPALQPESTPQPVQS